MATRDLGLGLPFGQYSHVGGRRPFGNHDSVMFHRALRHAAMVPNRRPAGGQTRTLIPKRDPGVFILSAGRVLKVHPARFPLERKACGRNDVECAGQGTTP